MERIDCGKLFGRTRMPSNSSFVNTMYGIVVYDGSIPVARYSSVGEMPLELQEKYGNASGLSKFVNMLIRRPYTKKQKILRDLNRAIVEIQTELENVKDELTLTSFYATHTNELGEIFSPEFLELFGEQYEATKSKKS